MTSPEEMKPVPPRGVGKRLLHWGSWGLIGLGGLMCLWIWVLRRSDLSFPQYQGGTPDDWVHYVEVAFPWLHGAGMGWFAARARWPRVGAALWLAIIVILYYWWNAWLFHEYGFHVSDSSWQL